MTQQGFPLCSRAIGNHSVAGQVRVHGAVDAVGQLADLLVEIAEVNVELVSKLPTLKDMDPLLERIGQIESQADGVYRRSVAHLFSGEFDAFEVLRAKDVVEAVERAVNAIERVSDGVETMLLKHS